MVKEGIINLYKPVGMTSHDCVNRIRRMTGIKRVGHTGTLDPNASGVLPICIGSAARITEYLDLDLKEYRCELVLGLETDTLDVWGKVLADRRSEVLGTYADDQACGALERGRIFATLREFEGVQEQIPPVYSAIRVDGVRLYEYARRGQEVDLEAKTRRVFIESVRPEKAEARDDGLYVTFSMVCSKGTYVRSVCRDLGEKLGTGAAMTALERTASGVFRAEDSVRLDELMALRDGDDVRDPETGRFISYARADEEKLNAFILPADTPLVNFGRAMLPAETAGRFVNGWHVAPDEAVIEKEPVYASKDFPLPIRPEFRAAYNLYDAESGGAPEFLGVAFFSEEYGKLVADKVFRKNP